MYSVPYRAECILLQCIGTEISTIWFNLAVENVVVKSRLSIGNASTKILLSQKTCISNLYNNFHIDNMACFQKNVSSFRYKQKRIPIKLSQTKRTLSYEISWYNSSRLHCKYWNSLTVTFIIRRSTLIIIYFMTISVVNLACTNSLSTKF